MIGVLFSENSTEWNQVLLVCRDRVLCKVTARSSKTREVRSLGLSLLQFAVIVDTY